MSNDGLREEISLRSRGEKLNVVKVSNVYQSNKIFIYVNLETLDFGLVERAT